MSQREVAGTAGRAGLAEVARGSALNLAGAVISAAATLATTVIVTRHFSRTAAGAFVTATSLFLIVEAVAGLGAANGAVYFIARLRPASEGSPGDGAGPSAGAQSQPARGAGPLTGAQRGIQDARDRASGVPGRTAGRAETGLSDGPGVGADRRVGAILRAAARPVLVASVLSAGLMLVFAEPLARLLAGGPLAKGGAAPGPAADAIRALAVAVPFAALADTFLGASRGFRNMLPTVVVDRIARPAAQVAGLIAAVAVGRAALLAPLWSLPYLPASLAAWLWLRRTRLRPHPPAKPAPVQWRAGERAGVGGLSGRPGTSPAGPGGHPAQPVTRHDPGWPGTHPDGPVSRPGLQEVPPALAVLLALSRPVPPHSPPGHRPGPHRRPASPSWTPPVPPPREPITQPLWFPGEASLPWDEIPPPLETAVPGPPWAPADPPSASQNLSAPDLAGRDEENHAAGFWAFTAPRALAGVAQIVLQRLDIVLVAVISGPAQAAVYAAATRFLVAGQLANAALIQAAQPQLSHLFGIGDRAAAGAVYQATTAWLIVLTWPLYLLSALFGPRLLAVFGRSYQDGATVVVILALAMLLATACGQVDLVLTTAGRSRWSLFNGLLAVLVNVAVDVALIPRAGITGAAIGWAAALAVSNMVPLIQVACVARVHPFGRGPAAAISVTAVAFGAVPLAARTVLGPSPAASLTGVAAGTLLAMAGLWCCRGALRLTVLPGLSPAVKSPGGKGKDEPQRAQPGASIRSWTR